MINKNGVVQEDPRWVLFVFLYVCAVVGCTWLWRARRYQQGRGGAGGSAVGGLL